jgi:hypothetical protein
VTQVVIYQNFTSETRALSQDSACGVIGVKSDTVGGFVFQSTPVFSVIIIPCLCTYLSLKLKNFQN